MSKQTEALKLALEGLEKWHFDKDPRGAADYIAAIHEALADHTEQPLEMVAEQPAQQGCMRCNTPKKCALYGCSPLTWPAEQPAQDDPDLKDKDPELVEQHYKQVVDDVRKVFDAKRETLPAQQDQGQSCYCPECERLSKELAALKAQQEPVAWILKPTMELLWPDEIEVKDPSKHRGYKPLYTSPQTAQPSKPWVGLTEFDIDQIPYSCSHADSRLIAYAIEAKLREKNT